MKIGTENKKQLYLAGGVGFVALLALYPLYNELFGGPPPLTQAPPPVIKDVTPGTAVRTSASGGTVGIATGRPGSKAVSAPPGFVVGGDRAAMRVGAGGGQLDPTLHMEAMRVTENLVYSGTGRNIFAAPGSVEAAPVKVLKPVAPARPVLVAQAPLVPQGPPPPPPINLKFFGTATNSKGVRQAFLLNGDDVFLASTGDIVQRRYRVVSISANSIQVEDIPNTNKQSLPMQPN
jgi:hypothetical protein